MSVSVVLASGRPAAELARAVEQLLPQCRDAGVELIVTRAVTDVASDPVPALDSCRLVPCRPGATIPEIRGAGLAAADGEWVLLTEDNCIVRPDWLIRLVAGCTPGSDVVGGVIRNPSGVAAIDVAAGIAEYGFYGPLQKPAAAPALACANVAYHRRVVEQVAAMSLAGHWENEIHARLQSNGARFRLVTDAVVEPGLAHRLGPFCRNRFEHGRHYATVRSEQLAPRWRVLRAFGTPLLPALLAWRVWRRAGRASPRDFVRALPYTLTFFAAWSLGEAAGYLRARATG